MKSISLALTLVTLMTASAQAAKLNETGRFAPWLAALEKPMLTSGDSRLVAQALIKSPGTRVAAFNVQALGRIYSDLDKKFKQLRFDFKAIEDGLGAVDKWTGVNNPAKAQQATEDLAKMLEENHWIGNKQSPKMEDVKDWLSKVNWPKEKKDQDYVSKELVKQLNYVDKTKFDFSTLEEGNGLHEFRRETRWFLIEARVLNGVLQFGQGMACPVNALQAHMTPDALAAFASGGYASLPSDGSVTDPCQISQCLFLDLVDAVDKIGKLKDKAEQQIANAGSDEVPADIKQRADAYYRDFKKNDALGQLANQIKSCQSDDGKKKHKKD